MGEIRTKALVSNATDPNSPELEIDVCVDSSAVMLLLGADIVPRLGLKIVGRAIAPLADESKIEMDRAGPVKLTIGDRSDYFSCLVGPLGCEPLIGQLVLEALDLIVDCSRRRLSPRPESPAYPSYKMK